MGGYRVRLLHTSDPYTKLKKGDEGDLLKVRPDVENARRILDVKWDSGSTLSLVEGEDVWEVFTEKTI